MAPSATKPVATPCLDPEGTGEQDERRGELLRRATLGVAEEPIDQGLLKTAALHVAVEHEFLADDRLELCQLIDRAAITGKVGGKVGERRSRLVDESCDRALLDGVARRGWEVGHDRDLVARIRWLGESHHGSLGVGLDGSIDRDRRARERNEYEVVVEERDVGIDDRPGDRAERAPDRAQCERRRPAPAVVVRECRCSPSHRECNAVGRYHSMKVDRRVEGPEGQCRLDGVENRRGLLGGIIASRVGPGGERHGDRDQRHEGTADEEQRHDATFAAEEHQAVVQRAVIAEHGERCRHGAEQDEPRPGDAPR